MEHGLGSRECWWFHRMIMSNVDIERCLWVIAIGEFQLGLNARGEHYSQSVSRIFKTPTHMNNYTT